MCVRAWRGARLLVMLRTGRPSTAEEHRAALNAIFDKITPIPPSDVYVDMADLDGSDKDPEGAGAAEASPPVLLAFEEVLKKVWVHSPPCTIQFKYHGLEVVVQFPTAADPTLSQAAPPPPPSSCASGQLANAC